MAIPGWLQPDVYRRREANARQRAEEIRQQAMTTAAQAAAAVAERPTAFHELSARELEEAVRRGPGAYRGLLERVQDDELERRIRQGMAIDWGTAPVFVPAAVMDAEQVRIDPQQLLSGGFQSYVLGEPAMVGIEYRDPVEARVPRPTTITAATALPTTITIADVAYDLDPRTQEMVPRDGRGDRIPLAAWRGLQRGPLVEPRTIELAGAGETVDAEYAALAAELNVEAGALERFRGLVRERGISVYDRAQVQEYLHVKYGIPPGDLTQRVVWGWRPLREDDRIDDWGLAEANGAVQPAARPYIKPIPFPVLLTVKAIVDQVGPAARFFVSDDMHGERIPDPFLLVMIEGHEFVVERWDEPAFRPKA